MRSAKIIFGYAVTVSLVLASIVEADGVTGGNQPHNNVQPSLGINYIIALEGAYPDEDEGGYDTTYLGEISMFAGNYAPRGWAFCEGQVLSIANYTALFSHLLTAYGGDGQTTFALPDFRGRTVIHEGTGPGLTNRVLGDRFIGTGQVSLSGSQISTHRHKLDSSFSLYTDYYIGGTTAHENMQPSAVVNYTIASVGVYPTNSNSFIGKVRRFVGAFAPGGEYFTDGQLMQISQNTILFSLLGTTYGGDGRTTFGLPELRGRAPIGVGTGPGLAPVSWGQKSGVESVSLPISEMASHSHTWNCGDALSLTTENAGGGGSHTNMQPTLGMNYIICLEGLFPPRDSGYFEGDFLGEVCLFAGNFAPRNWALCHGQILSIDQYQALYSILETTYGGDGRTTFALPDLRGRIAVHPGYSAGGINLHLGQKYGSNTHALSVAQMRAHSHGIYSDYKADSDGDEICDLFDTIPGCNDLVNLKEDWIIDIWDLKILASAWLYSTDGTEDVNRDGKVDLYDLSIMANDWMCQAVDG